MELQQWVFLIFILAESIKYVGCGRISSFLLLIYFFL